VGHNVVTTFELGWSQIKNGELLQRAESGSFDGLVSTDQQLKYQQNLTGRRIAIAILSTTSWPRIDKHSTEVAKQIDLLVSGAYIEIAIP
jgi:hypothetical protein